MTGASPPSGTESRSGATSGRPKISVAICSHNGSASIGAALAAIGAQIHDVAFELIVVDDGSTDDTAEIAATSDARVIRLGSNRGRGEALQEAIAAARGPILAMADDDCVPPPHWVQQLADQWASAPSDVTVIGGPVKPLDLDTFHRRFVDFRRPLAALELDSVTHAGVGPRLWRALFPPPPRPDRRSVLSIPGANMSLRLAAVREVGGFDTAVRFGGEEELLCRRLQAVFGPDTVQFVPHIEMFHDFRPKLSDSLRRARAYGLSHGRLWRRDGGIPKVRPLPLLVALLVVPLFARRPRLGVAGLVIAPPLLYRGWPARCRETSTLEPVLYPYVCLLEDLAGIGGFLAGLRDPLAD
ncbi:MAG: glycosyltransferase family 2 protein [Acidimicrobiales bacterium]